MISKLIKTISILALVTAMLMGIAVLLKSLSTMDRKSVTETDLGSESAAAQTEEPKTDGKAQIDEELKADDEPVIDENPDIRPDEENEDMIENKLASMTLHEKICQMIIVWPEQLSGRAYPQTSSDGIEEGLKKYPVGGIIYFADNLVNPEQTRDMITKSQESAGEIEGIPLFICVDEEGGNTLRIACNPSFGQKETPAMVTMKDEKQVKAAAAEIGRYLHELGFNFDFAPDADVLTNPLNQIIDSRSFGTDSKRVCQMAKAYSDGLHEAGILSSYKHFPGHGATEGDTHEGFAFTNKTLDELMEADLIPFIQAQADGADSVMVAHISLPTILGDNTPCTLSHEIITDLLRNKFNYEGLIITDALNMKAITDNYEAGRAAVMTVKAGSDIVLMPLELDRAVEAIEEAVERGEIEESRIDESVRRILETKNRIK